MQNLLLAGISTRAQPRNVRFLPVSLPIISATVTGFAKVVRLMPLPSAVNSKLLLPGGLIRASSFTPPRRATPQLGNERRQVRASRPGVSTEVDEKNGQIAHRRIVAGREILRNYGRNNNPPATGGHPYRFHCIVRHVGGNNAQARVRSGERQAH